MDSLDHIHPRYEWYCLECGHVVGESHQKRTTGEFCQGDMMEIEFCPTGVRRIKKDGQISNYQGHVVT